MNPETSTFLLVIMAGLIGGFVNGIIVGLRPWGWVVRQDGRSKAYDLGAIGDVVVGGAAAFVYWGLGLGNPEPPQVYAAAFLSGLGGSRILGELLRVHLNRAGGELRKPEQLPSVQELINPIAGSPSSGQADLVKELAALVESLRESSNAASQANPKS